MSNEIEILTQLKKQLIDFLDELIESFPDEPDFVIFRIFAKDQIPILDIMKYIVEKLLPLRQMVKERNDKFFLNYNILFERFDEAETKKVNYFKNLWLSPKVDNQDRNVIWSWFDSFLYLAEKFEENKNE